MTAQRPRYEEIGVGYARTRREDPALRERIHAALGDARNGALRALGALDVGMRLIVSRS